MTKSNKIKFKRIIFIGRRNVGKSSLVNAFLGKEVCTVEGCKDNIREAKEIPFELPPYGSIVVVDTVPFDVKDEIKSVSAFKQFEAYTHTDFAIVVLDARDKFSAEDKSIFYQLKNLEIPFLVAVNKIEFGINSELINGLRAANITHFEISCKEKVGIDTLKAHLTRLFQSNS